MITLDSVLWIACLPSNTEVRTFRLGTHPWRRQGSTTYGWSCCLCSAGCWQSSLQRGALLLQALGKGRGSSFLQSIGCVIATNGCKTLAHLPASSAGAREGKICKLSLCSRWRCGTEQELSAVSTHELIMAVFSSALHPSKWHLHSTRICFTHSLWFHHSFCTHLMNNN